MRKLGFTIMRLQPIHKGHQLIIDKALSECERVLLFIGSSQERDTERNPIPVRIRYNFVEAVYREEIKQGRLVVYGLVDQPQLNDAESWSDHVITCMKEIMNQYPDTLYISTEEAHNQWYKEESMQETEIVRVPYQQDVNISATKLRQAILDDDFETYKSFTDEKLHGHSYKLLHVILTKVKNMSNIKYERLSERV